MAANMPTALTIATLHLHWHRTPIEIKLNDVVEFFQPVSKGQPLPKARAEVATPSGWRQSRQTGATGKSSTTLPWSGPHVLGLTPRDDTPGQRSPTGVALLPAAPAAKPNK